MTTNLAYSTYWRRKQLLAEQMPMFPVRRWWETDELCDSDQVIHQAIKTAPSVLDVGAGDLRLMRKLQSSRVGYSGEYHTQDIGGEYTYTYRDLSQVERKYGAILCMDVIEHLTLEQGLALIARLVSLLDSDGRIVIQTPNARCVRTPLSWDMTHLHCYNLTDLWAFLRCFDLSVEGYRVVLTKRKRTLIESVRFTLGAFVVTKLLGSDYADNILLVARKLGSN